MGGSQFKADSKAKKSDPPEKWTKAKRAGGIGQVVKSLPSKYKALNLNPSNANKIKNKHK
jgi:hypothetical protein